MIIVKIGGGASINTEGIIAGLSNLEEQILIVHGANSFRDDLADRLGIERRTVTSISGYQSVFSDNNTIDLQMMAYAGLKNKRIVEMCYQNGIEAIGLSGIDGAVIRSRRNRGIRVEENGKKRVLRDLSGKPVEINRALLETLMSEGYTPVLTVPLLDENNCAVNSENDDIVALLTEVLNADSVVHFIEAPGFLEDPAQEDSVIRNMNNESLCEWEASCSGRIRRKLKAIKRLVDAGTRVHICDGRTENPIEDFISGGGTRIEH